MDVSKFRPQSGTVERSTMQSDANVKAEVTTFSDANAGFTQDMDTQPDATFDAVATSDTSLTGFLSRPVLIARYSWPVGQDIDETFAPWSLFYDNSVVRDKLRNYALLRSKLRTKILVNGTAFHYGRALVSWLPLASPGENLEPSTYVASDLVRLSQRPHHFIDPSNNEGGCMCLPFFFPKNYLDVVGRDWRRMGSMNIKSFVPLQHANGGDDPVTISVYAWAEDISLTMPTAHDIQPVPTALTTGKVFTPQSGDEYGQGVISKPATTVAHVAGMLTEAPFIGPYARATELAANAVGKIAAMFGFSRPPIVSDIVQVKPFVGGNLANTDAPDAVQKLSLDSKQELTVDPRVTGLAGADELGMVSFMQRESYIDTFTWSPSNASETLLWNARVTPVNYRVDSGRYFLTPAALALQYFEEWKGSVRYRFQIVKSNFHKGRLYIRYDPVSNLANSGYNNAYNRIIDIEELSDFEIVVGWGQSRPLREVDLLDPPQLLYDTTRFAAETGSSVWNGVLEVGVLNTLTSPATDSTISINVFVSTCDDLKFGKPSFSGPTNLTYIEPIVPTPPPTSALRGYFTPQSGESIVATENQPSEAVDTMTIAKEGEQTDPFYHVFFGETIPSIRTLMKRYYYEKSFVLQRIDDTTSYWRLRATNVPIAPGWDPDGLDVSEVDGSTPLMLAGQSPVILFGSCFAGWRGGTRKKYMLEQNAENHMITVSRREPGTNVVTLETLSSIVTPAYIQKNITQKRAEFNCGGSAVTLSEQNNTIEVELPFYSNTRFQEPRTTRFGSDNHEVTVILSPPLGATIDTGSDLVLNSYTSIGEDFNLFFFSGVPPLYYNQLTADS